MSLEENVQWAVRALRLAAIREGEFVLVLRNVLLRATGTAWRGAGGPKDHVSLLRIQHDALAALYELTAQVQDATSDDEAISKVQDWCAWWVDNVALTGLRAGALDGMVANQSVYYYGPDFRITAQDVDEAIQEARERVGDQWADLMEAKAI